MAFSLDTFKSNIAGKGAYSFTRSNLFKVAISLPTGVGNSGNGTAESIEFLARAASVPSYTQGTVEVPFRGRTLKISGDRTYEPFTVTIMNTMDQKLRNSFEKWMSILQFETHNFAKNTNVDIFGTADVELLKRNKKDDEEDYKVIRGYRMHYVWPSSVSAVDLDWGNNDAVQEFTVELQVQYVTQGKNITEAKDRQGDEEDADEEAVTED